MRKLQAEPKNTSSYPRARFVMRWIMAAFYLLAGTRLRRLAGIMLALYAVCVFPANVKHAIDGIHLPPAPDSWWYHGPRLALQPVLVWWALFCSGVIDWPFRAKSPRR